MNEVFPSTETRYTLTLINRTLIVDEEVSIGGDAMVVDDVASATEGRRFTLAPQVSGGVGMYRYQWTEVPEKSHTVAEPEFNVIGYL